MAHTSLPRPWGHTSPVGRPPGLPRSLRTCRHKSEGDGDCGSPASRAMVGTRQRQHTPAGGHREERLPGRERTRGKGWVPLSPISRPLSSLPLPGVCPGTQAVWVGGLSAVGSGYACTGGRPEAPKGKRLPAASTPAPPRDPRTSREKFLLPLHERGRCKERFPLREWEVREDCNFFYKLWPPHLYMGKYFRWNRDCGCRSRGVRSSLGWGNLWF